MRKMLIKVFKYFWITVSNFFNHIKYKFKKRDYSIVVIGAWGGKTFSDNSRFLFQYLSQNKDSLGLTHVVWITEKEQIKSTLNALEYECYLIGDKQAEFYKKKAGYHIVCCGDADIGGEYSYNAVKVNLWHGLGGIKGVNFASNGYYSFKCRHPVIYKILFAFHKVKFIRKNLLLKGGWNDCYYISTTEFETSVMKKYFELPDYYFIRASYARLLPCLKLLPEEVDIIERVKNNKTILYLPTFRSAGSDYQIPTNSRLFVDFLEKNNILWVKKKHAVDEINIQGIESNNIIDLPLYFDINVLIPYVKAVVSDYSSVVFDALYHNVPVFFYTPDFDYYATKDRGFVLPSNEFLFGKQVYTLDELKKLLDDYKLDFKTSMSENIKDYRDKFWGLNMDYEQIWEKIKTIREKKSRHKQNSVN